MTPDKARALLDGTTPGPWELSSSRSVVGIDIVMYDGTVMERRNVALAAAAPVLAAMIAGMREEWIGQYLEHEGKWATICAYTTREEVARHLDHGSWDAYTHTRITRRYVTEPEET